MRKLEIKAKIKEALAQAVEYLSMAKVFFITTLIAFIFSALKVYLDEKIYTELCLAFLMAASFTVPVTLLTQKLSILKKYGFQILAAGLGFVTGFFSYRGFGNSVYSDLYYFGILCAVILVILYIFIPKQKSRSYFALVFKHALFCIFMTLILMGGLCLLIYAVQNLILNTDDDDIYSCCCLFCAIVFGINTFIYYLFYKRQEEGSGKAFKVIALYIMFPVFAVLLFILYVYLIKALVLLKLPSGQINWFVSFASCFFIVFYFILREYDDMAVIKFFYKFGAIPFIPLIVIQLYAYFIRVNAYGFTGYRYSSLLFIIFSIITIALTFIKKGKYTYLAIPVLTFIVLLDSVSPFNLINMAHKSQTKIMMKVLNKYDLYDAETDSLKIYDPIALEKAITDEDRAALKSSYRYITYTSSIPRPKWTEEIKTNSKGEEYKSGLSFTELFGIKSEKQNEILLTFDKYFSHNDEIDISGYTKMTNVYHGEYAGEYKDGKYDDYAKQLTKIIYTTRDGTKYDLTQFLLDIDPMVTASEPLWYKYDENTAFCFTHIEYKYNTERKQFYSYNYSFYFFTK